MRTLRDMFTDKYFWEAMSVVVVFVSALYQIFGLVADWILSLGLDDTTQTFVGIAVAVGYFAFIWLGSAQISYFIGQAGYYQEYCKNISVPSELSNGVIVQTTPLPFDVWEEWCLYDTEVTHKHTIIRGPKDG